MKPCDYCGDRPAIEGEDACVECKAEIEYELSQIDRYGDPASQYGGGWGF